MAFKLELSGLSAVKRNFEKLDLDVQRKIGRDSLRYFSWLIASPMRAATYVNFNRRTGAIKKGLSVAVQFEPSGGKLKSWVVEYPQPLGGPATPFRTLVRKRIAKKSRRTAPLSYTAFWWRYLEFGTQPRHRLRTVKVNPRSKRFASQVLAQRKSAQSASRGAISARRWLRPVYAAVAPEALKKFRDYFLKLVDAAVSAMPK